MIIVYASRLNNTNRFIERVANHIEPRPKLLRVPWSVSAKNRPALHRALDYAISTGEGVLLVAPSYRRYNESQLGLQYVPLPIEKFLLYKEGIFSSRVDGVVGTGNMTFGKEFCRGAYELSELLTIPLVATVDMSGSELDDKAVIDFVNEHQDAEANRKFLEEEQTEEPV